MHNCILDTIGPISAIPYPIENRLPVVIHRFDRRDQFLDHPFPYSVLNARARTGIIAYVLRVFNATTRTDSSHKRFNASAVYGFLKHRAKWGREKVNYPFQQFLIPFNLWIATVFLISMEFDEIF